MVPPASHRVSRVPWYSGSQSKAFLFNIQDYYLLRWAFPDLFYYNSRLLNDCVRNPNKASFVGLGSSLFARHYSGNRFFFLFLRVLRCFSSPGLPSDTYLFSNRYLDITPSGFPHSDIPGSMLACSFPRLIAAYHVLHRLLVPRHPPFALISLTIPLCG